MIKREVVALIQILSQRLQKSDGVGYSKYVGDGLWKIKIRTGLNIEEEVDTIFHEMGEILFELYRGWSSSKNCEHLDHMICVDIAKKASDTFMKRLKEGKYKERKWKK